MDDDGLLAAGVPGVQLTWMDAKVGDWVVTPRIGKPVEVQALWLNALRIAGDPLARARRPRRSGAGVASARASGTSGSLFDVVDVDHVRGRDDPSLRPNQIFAVGGLPLALLERRARRGRVVETVETRLLTPLGSALARAGRPGLSRRATRAACPSATAPTTRARSGPG